MASSGGALNLSLLSRGIGEISKNGHEKIDVVFEPQDYFNFVGNSSRIYLPPIPPKYDFDGIPNTTKSSHFKSSQEIPKTFTTRKGALLLYSEDQAHKVQSSHHDFKKAGHRRPHPTEETLELSKSADELELKTVDDLAKSILSFGKREPTNDDTDIYLGFIHNTYGRRKKDLFERQIRPGFSAKRYLSLWTKSWDDNVLGKVISKGYLTEKSLFYYNPLNPHLQRRLNDDMSHFPAPYKLMRSMLMSPGSLSGYTFYRVRPESAETVVTPEQQPERTPSQMGSIKVISTKDGVQKEVSYSTLDKVAQEEVLTDLLVKSAVHYAMKKQQELMEGSQREEAIQEVDENRSSVQQFDMRDAVESLLDSQKSKGVLNTDFPEDKSEASSRSGSIKGKTLKRRSKDKDVTFSAVVSILKFATSPLPFDNAEGEKEYVGSVPVASVRGDQSSVPQLPHISGAMPLTPIGEASREGTRMTIPVSLPPIGQDQGIDGVPLLTVIPPTPQHSSLTASPTKMVKDSKLLPQDEGNEEFSDESGVGVKTERTDRRYGEETERKRRVRKIKAENTGPSVSGGYHLHSSTESLGGPDSAHSLPTAKPLRTHWKGSTQSLKSDRSKKGSSSLPEDSNKGSIVIGPDGEPISVGGHIEAHTRPEQQHIENVGDANRYFGRGSSLSDILIDKYKSDLISDQESDDEPDVWKRRRGVQREDMRNYAHKREKRPIPPRRPIVQRQPSLKSKSNSLSSFNKTVRFSASSKDKDEGFEEIDYTGGDIDATLSINSWSYQPRDTDPEFVGIVSQMNRASSLPGMPFRSDENTKEFTQLLSRATEKTEEGMEYPGEMSPDKSVDISHVSVPVAKPGTAPTDGHITPGTPINTEDNQGLVSRLSRHEEEVFDDGSAERQMSRESDGRRSISRSKLSDKRKSMSQSEMKSDIKIGISDQGRRSSMSDAERKASTLSKREGRASKVSIHSYSRTSSRHDPETPIADPLLETEQEHGLDTPREDQEGERETNSLEKSNSHKSLHEGAVTPPLEEEKEPDTDGKESDKQSRKKSQSSLGTVAPSRPGSQKQIVIPSGSESTPSPTNEKPSSPALPSDYKVGSASSKIEDESGPTEEADHAESGPGEDVAHAESGPSEKLNREGSGQSLQSQQISEKDIINVLEDTARHIAASTLSRSDSGQDLEKDARQAAELWLEKNAPRIISRSQSVQDTQGDQAAIRSAVENGRKSAGPTAGEYKDLIKEKLQTALSNTDGESIPQIPDDAELSPELLEALKNNSVTPEDIEIVKDEETGKSVVRSRSQMSAAMGGVKEGHIYVPVAKNSNKQHGTIPTDRQSNADLGEIEVINYGARSSDAGSKVGSARTHSSKKSEKLSDKAPSEKSSEKGGKSQPPSVLGESIVEEDEQEDMKSQRSGGQMSQKEVEEPEDEFKKALVEVEKVNEAEQQKDPGRQSVVSKKSETSAVSDKKSAVSDDKKSVHTEKSDAKKAVAKKEEFVVDPLEEYLKNLAAGKVNTKGELEKLFGELGLPPTKPTTKKKGKPKDTKGKKAPAKKPGKATKGKKAKDEEPKPTPVEEPPTEEPPPKEPTPPPSLPPLEDKGASDNESDKRSKVSTRSKASTTNLRKFQSKESIAETAKSSESDFEFHFVRETPSPSPPPPPKPPSTIPSVDDEPTDDDEKQEGEDDEAARLRMISNREARAAKRAAQAAKRKEDVERKRREKEEQARRERDEQERAEQLKREMEAERRKTLEAKRQRKMEEDEEREREAQLEEEKMAKQKAEAEKERRRKEEYQRKLEEMKRKQAEEEQKRYEEMLERQREEEERRKEEEEMMAKMAEEERLEYERKKKLEEEERKRKEEEDKKRREEEAQRAMEEARRLAEEMARKQAEMEARLKFNRTLQVEARGLDHSHNITEAFVFSYFELLNWFGLDVPEFELLKLSQY
ncbi:titin homolog isoform X5 [Mytilus californianus]|uniref:titin homolog isoform X5 n=1 Tax=Mytilus californianus TaxID=6549 RepID=UPI0022464B8F|nr:titin homolog isoform X5 [Mytilus californianus]